MRKATLVIIFLFGFLIAKSSTVDSLLLAKVNTIAIAVQKKYAPDKRTDIFQATISDNIPNGIVVESTIPQAIAEFKANLQNENIFLNVIESLLPAKELNGNIYGVANLSVGNNRKEPQHSAELVTQVLLGTPLQVLKKQPGFTLVRSPDRYISWLDNAAVTLMDEATYNGWQSSKKVVYIKDFGHSYSASSSKSQSVSDLVQGDILKLNGVEKGFYKVSYPDNRIAYIPIKEAQPFEKWVSRPNPNAAAILATAKTMMGIPYLWGGTSVKGMDCSGFTKTSFFLNGVVLPRDASQQALVGEAVDIYQNDTVSIAQSVKNLLPGDLLFFTASATGRTKDSRITHTAIYMGNGEFIQEAGSVCTGSLLQGAENYDDYRTKTLVKARRMLTSIGMPNVSRIDKHPFYTIYK